MTPEVTGRLTPAFGRRAAIAAFAVVVLVFVVAFVLLRPVTAPLTDEQYIAIAKDSPSGQLYFKNHNAPCSVVRVWNVQVNCDYVGKVGDPTEKFRVYIDPRTNQIIDTDMQFKP